MQPFLQLVARTYLKEELSSLGEYCFVFPNKRSGTFFKHFLTQEGQGSMFMMPDIKTISEFVTEFSPLVEASRYEQLFILYNEYRKLSKDISDFDKFLFWGDMLISDFNDVDRYLVDPRKLFTNVHDLKEINSTYLTEEQLAIVRRYWGDDQPQAHVEAFWTHISHDGDDGKKHKSQEKFLKLWEILYPLFTGFKSSLRRLGLSTSGMYYRNAVDRLDLANDEPLPFRRYIFVGFNVLSASELKIFRLLQKRGLADFYWDFNSPAFGLPHNRATRFIASNVEEFKSRYDLGEAPAQSFPAINIIGVPSNVGQAKVAGGVLQKWINNGRINDPANAVDTAVVLPDETLFIPVMHSVPGQITGLNITMGLPLRSTPLASVLRSVTSMQLRARSVQGNIHLFYDDVRSLLSQPLIRSISPSDCDKIMADIRANRRFTIDAHVLASEYPALGPLFEPVKQSQTLDGAYRYLRSLVNFLIDNVIRLDSLKRVMADEDEDEDESEVTQPALPGLEIPIDTSLPHSDTDKTSEVKDKGDSDVRLRLYFLQTCLSALDSLYEAASKYSVEMRHNTFFHLFEKALGSDTVNFVGEPLKGLQIMGVLETRALDFRNIVMLSMNERIFPRKQYTASFIPDTLRRGFGMATMDFQESIFAYYFYRLISRAESVTLLYDGRKVGGKSSEMSRYLSQLLYVYNQQNNVRHSLAVYSGNYFEPQPISIPKTEAVMEKLSLYTIDDEKRQKYLSASSLNTYINCPLAFYLQYVEGYSETSDVTEYMDSSTFGTIVHNVAQRIYQTMGERDHNVVITRDKLLSLLDKTDTRIGRYVTEEVNKEYQKLKKENRNRNLTGESLVLGKIIEKCIRDMIKYEADINDVFTFIRAEYKMKGRYKVSPQLTVNVKQVIDRVDRLSDGSLRFIDYKTGTDSYTTPSVNNTIDSDVKSRDKAIFQLLFYCNVYSALENYDGPIRPLVYAFRKMAVDRGILPVKIGKEEIVDYHTVNDTYRGLLHDKIAEIFDPAKPFVQAKTDKSCKYCQFKAICGRYPSDN